MMNKILVIDDEGADGFIARRCCNPGALPGYQFQYVTDGPAAMALLENDPDFCFIVCDRVFESLPPERRLGDSPSTEGAAIIHVLVGRMRAGDLPKIPIALVSIDIPNRIRRQVLRDGAYCWDWDTVDPLEELRRVL